MRSMPQRYDATNSVSDSYEAKFHSVAIGDISLRVCCTKNQMYACDVLLNNLCISTDMHQTKEISVARALHSAVDTIISRLYPSHRDSVSDTEPARPDNQNPRR